MINLIPNEEKKKMVKDFYLRLGVVSFTVLGVSLILASIAILPPYFIFSAKKDSLDIRLEAEKNKPNSSSNQEILNTAENLNKKIKLIEISGKNKFVFSERVLDEVIFSKMPDIKIKRITYENNLEGDKKVNIYGEAPSRERLLLFQKKLEGHPYFSKVDSPISNFVKGSDIEFNISLVPNLPEKQDS